MSAASPPPFQVSAQSSSTRYRSVRKIASGGMGTVELAVAASGRSLGRMVAVKRLRPHLAEDERFLDMFFDELAITASLHHPHIVEIVDWGQDDHGHFLVLEYVPGDSLFALARATQKRRIPFPVDLALYVVACTAEGLHASELSSGNARSSRRPTSNFENRTMGDERSRSAAGPSRSLAVARVTC
jgi:serine/threonine protein kinase